MASSRASDWKGNAFTIGGMVEKPAREKAPPISSSPAAISAAGNLRRDRKQAPGAGGEIQITDAMIRLMVQAAFWGIKYEARLTIAVTRSASFGNVVFAP